MQSRVHHRPRKENGVRAIPAVLLAGGVLTLAIVAAGGAADKPPPGPTPDALVRDLGSAFFATREQAAATLWKRGREAVPALEKAAADPNPEVARRAREILDKFRWGVFPDTPPAVLKLIDQFRAGTPAERKTALVALTRGGPAGCAAARAVLRQDLPADARDPLVAHLTTLLRREVPLLLFDGKADEAADRVALHAAGTTPEGAADFAAFHLLRDTLPAAVADAEAARATARTPAAASLVLAHLYRAKRDWAKARAAAADIPRPATGSSLVELLLEEEGDWAALRADPPPGPVNLPDALRLTFLRLADKGKAFDAEAKKVRDGADDLGLREDVRDAAFALLLNHRAAAATELLREKRQNLGLLAEILIARLRFKDALALSTPAKDADAEFDRQEKLDADLRRARVLVLTGRREEAVQLFTRVADGLKNLAAEVRDWDDIHRARRALLRSELRAGLRDLACEHAGLYVADAPDSGNEPAGGETVFDLLFGTDADPAETLYRALRADRPAGEAAGVTLRRARDLLAGTAPAAAVDDAIKRLAEDRADEGVAVPGAPEWVAFRRKVNRLGARAAVFRAAGRHADAEAAFAAAADAAVDGPEVVGARAWVFGTSDAARPWLDYADYLYDRGRFAAAAARFEAGWKRFPDQPLLLFMSGRALVKDGRAKEGGRRMELAHWVGLGNEKARGKFLEELVRRGEAAAAQRETDLLLRACWSRDFYFGNVMNQAARAAALNKDWATAERSVQRSLLVLMKTPGVHFVDSAAYLNIPHEMLVFRARGLLAAGKVDAAVAQARAVLDVTPGHAELVSGLVPDLDALGRKKEADELFGRAWAAYRAVLADYPDSPAARNALAVIGANCRRELDAALAAATEAVAFDPKSAAYRETLAEVHFRRGDRAKALALMTKLAAEHPRSYLFRRQLLRYKSGDVGGPVPDREED